VRLNVKQSLILPIKKSQLSIKERRRKSITKTYSDVSRRINNKSIAAENAANARPPPNAAFGPEFLARMPPAMNPAPTEL
jgi:hypothetical protein